MRLFIITHQSLIDSFMLTVMIRGWHACIRKLVMCAIGAVRSVEILYLEQLAEPTVTLLIVD